MSENLYPMHSASIMGQPQWLEDAISQYLEVCTSYGHAPTIYDAFAAGYRQAQCTCGCHKYHHHGEPILDETSPCDESCACSCHTEIFKHPSIGGDDILGDGIEPESGYNYLIAE